MLPANIEALLIAQTADLAPEEQSLVVELCRAAGRDFHIYSTVRFASSLRTIGRHLEASAASYEEVAVGQLLNGIGEFLRSFGLAPVPGHHPSPRDFFRSLPPARAWALHDLFGSYRYCGVGLNGRWNERWNEQ